MLMELCEPSVDDSTSCFRAFFGFLDELMARSTRHNMQLPLETAYLTGHVIRSYDKLAQVLHLSRELTNLMQ